MESIERLQLWYHNQCNGDWEHDFGIKLETLDNPGWLLNIDLQSTSLQEAVLEVKQEKSAFDWYHIKIEKSKYSAAGDPNKLKFLIDYFLEEIIPTYSDPKFEYEVLVPLYGAPEDVWITGYANMVNSREFEIIRINSPDSQTILSKTLASLGTLIQDFSKFELRNKKGDWVETELVETFRGMKLGIKKSHL